MLGGVELGVQIVGSELGLKSTLAESVAAADAWAEATEAAGVRAARGIELTGVAARQAEVAYAKMGIAVSKFAEDTTAAQAAAVRYEATVSGLYERQIAQANAAAAAQERAALKYQTSLTTIGRNLSTYVTLPLAAAGYAAIKLSTEFQASMTRVQTYAGASAAEVKRMETAILNSANVLPQGPIKAAEALYHLESIGIRGAHALTALKAASLAAGAGQANLTDATTALGGALVSNIKGAQDTKQAMANLIAIAGQGNMTLQNLTDAMGTGLLVKAGNVGISLHEVGAALDVLVDRGIPARRAATYLGTTFALMVAPSQAAKNAAEDLGVSWEKMGSMLQQPNGLLKVLQMFHERVQAVGQTRGMRDVMDMFGRSRQSTGIQTLIESFNAPVSSYVQKLQTTDAATKASLKTLDAYQQTAQYKMHIALSMLEADFIKVGNGVKGPVAEGLQAAAHTIDEIVREFDRLPAPIKEMIGGLVGFAAVVGPLALFAGGMMKVSHAIRQVFMDMGILPKSAATAAGGVEAAMGSMQGSMVGLATTSSDLKATFASLPGEVRGSLDLLAAEFAEIPVSARAAAAEAATAFAELPIAAREAALAVAVSGAAPFAELGAQAREAVGGAASVFAEIPAAAREAAVSAVVALRQVDAAIAAESPLVDRFTAEAAAYMQRLPLAAREAVAEMMPLFESFSVSATADIAGVAASFAALPEAARAAGIASAGAFAEVPAALKAATAEAASSYAVLPPAAREAVVASSATFAQFPAEVQASMASAVSALAELPIAAREAAVRSVAALSEISVELPAETRAAAVAAASALESLPAEARFAAAGMVAAFADLVPGAREAAVAASTSFAALPADAREAALVVAESFNTIPMAAREAAVRTMAAFAELPAEMRVQFATSVAAAAEELSTIPAAARAAAVEAGLSFSQLSAGARGSALAFADAAEENAILQQVTEKTTTAVEQLTLALGEVGPASAGIASATGEVAALGSAAQKTAMEMAAMDEATASGIAAGGVGRLSGMIGTGMTGLMRGGMFAMGGLIAGQMASSMIGGETGQVTGDVLKGVGLGAGIGTMIPLPGATLAGAAVGGLVMGLKDLIHTGPSVEQQMSGMSHSFDNFGMAARMATQDIKMMRSQVANLNLQRDQLKVQIGQDKAAVRQAPNNRMYRDQLIADEAQLQAIDVQLSQAQNRIDADTKKHNKSLEEQKKIVADITGKTQDLSQVTHDYTRAGEFVKVGDAWIRIGTATGQAKNDAEAYAQELLKMAQSAESSDPKLSEVYYKLHDIAVETGKIPTDKEVRIAVHTVFDGNTKLLLFGLAGLGKGLDKTFSDMFKGLKTSTTTSGGGLPPLNTKQQIDVALAKNPNDRSALEAEIRYDNEHIAQLKKLRQEGKIGNQQYVDEVTALYQDRNQMESTLKSLGKKDTTAQSKAQTAFEKKVRNDELLAKARLDLENGQYAAATELLRKDKARLEAMLKEAKTSEERIAVQRQLLEVERLMKSKAGSFALSMKLQLAMARADALAALDPGLGGPTALQIKLAEQAKAQAMKAINSHKLSMQALIDAWGIVSQANSVIAQGVGSKAKLYHTVSTDTVADAVKGLTEVQEMQLREALAQRDAHRGHAPNSPAADGYGAGTAAAPGPRGSMITFNGARFEVNGVQDVRRLMAELEKLIRQRYQRAGGRR